MLYSVFDSVLKKVDMGFGFLLCLKHAGYFCFKGDRNGVWVFVFHVCGLNIIGLGYVFYWVFTSVWKELEIWFGYLCHVLWVEYCGSWLCILLSI